VTAAGANGAWYTQGVGTAGVVANIPYTPASSQNPRYLSLDDGTNNNGIALIYNSPASRYYLQIIQSSSATYNNFSAGAIAGVFCYLMVAHVKARFGYDDSLDAFGVHGAGGTIGALLTGVFAQQVINPIFGAGKDVGGLDGHWGQIGNQLVGVLIAWVLALVGTIILLKITDLITGVRVPEEHEIEGLDITQHGEEAYNLES